MGNQINKFLKGRGFLAPLGAQEVCSSVCVPVCVSVCDFYEFFTKSSLNLYSIFTQSSLNLHSIFTQSVKVFHQSFSLLAVTLQSLCSLFAVSLQSLCSLFTVFLQSFCSLLADSRLSFAFSCPSFLALSLKSLALSLLIHFIILRAYFIKPLGQKISRLVYLDAICCNMDYTERSF